MRWQLILAGLVLVCPAANLLGTALMALNVGAVRQYEHQQSCKEATLLSEPMSKMIKAPILLALGLGGLKILLQRAANRMVLRAEVLLSGYWPASAAALVDQRTDYISSPLNTPGIQSLPFPKPPATR